MKAYHSKLHQHKIFQSMSRKGNCLDNLPMENFFGLLKQDFFHVEIYRSFSELKTKIDQYIYYYNNKRMKKKLNWQSPVQRSWQKGCLIANLSHKKRVDFSTPLSLTFGGHYNSLSFNYHKKVRRIFVPNQNYTIKLSLKKTHLDEFEREEIERWLLQKKSISEIERLLNRHRSTIYWELKEESQNK